MDGLHFILRIGLNDYGFPPGKHPNEELKVRGGTNSRGRRGIRRGGGVIVRIGGNFRSAAARRRTGIVDWVIAVVMMVLMMVKMIVLPHSVSQTRFITIFVEGGAVIVEFPFGREAGIVAVGDGINGGGEVKERHWTASPQPATVGEKAWDR